MNLCDACGAQQATGDICNDCGGRCAPVRPPLRKLCMNCRWFTNPVNRVDTSGDFIYPVDGTCARQWDNPVNGRPCHYGEDVPVFQALRHHCGPTMEGFEPKPAAASP